MKHIKLSILLSVVFLSGCAFHGIMPQQYDGETLERNNEAIDAYIDHGQILTPNVVRYPFIESTELVELVDVARDAQGDETESVEAGAYDVPEDIEAGVYRLEIGGDVSSSAVVVYDSNDVRVLETSLLGRNGVSEVMLDDGYRLEFKTRFGSLDVTPTEIEEFTPEDGAIFIPQGIYVVGEQLAPGDYQLISEEMLLMRSDNTPEVYWNSYGTSYEHVMERTMSDDYRPVELQDKDASVNVNVRDGDILIVQKYLVITEN